MKNAVKKILFFILDSLIRVTTKSYEVISYSRSDFTNQIGCIKVTRYSNACDVFDSLVSNGRQWESIEMIGITRFSGSRRRVHSARF